MLTAPITPVATIHLAEKLRVVSDDDGNAGPTP
jgi:hypothetical protein